MLRRLLYAPFLVQLVVTRRCNLACAYCAEYDRSSPPVPKDVLLQRLERIRALGAWSVEFTGGEPLLHPDLEELVRAARKLRFLRTMLISNAFLLDEERVERLNAVGLQALQVSVDGVRPSLVTIKVLDRLRKQLQALARHARFSVVLNAVIGSLRRQSPVGTA